VHTKKTPLNKGACASDTIRQSFCCSCLLLYGISTSPSRMGSIKLDLEPWRLQKSCM